VNNKKETSVVKVDDTTAVDVWDKGKRDVIRKLFAPKLSQEEFMFFVGLGKSLNANPFTKEIWAIKFGNNPATIFLARDFYRKKAQEQVDYNGHAAVAVYENDEFSFDATSGIPTHNYSLKDRGDLLGAYALAWRKGIDRPFYKFVYLAEYNLKQSNWNTKPVMMIEKVAEAQILKMAWQGVFKGTYAEDEQGVIEASYKAQGNGMIDMTEDDYSDITEPEEIKDENPGSKP